VTGEKLIESTDW